MSTTKTIKNFSNQIQKQFKLRLNKIDFRETDGESYDRESDKTDSDLVKLSAEFPHEICSSLHLLLQKQNGMEKKNLMKISLLKMKEY